MCGNDRPGVHHMCCQQMAAFLHPDYPEDLNLCSVFTESQLFKVELCSSPELICQISSCTRAGQLRSVTLGWPRSSLAGVALSRLNSPVAPSCGWCVIAITCINSTIVSSCRPLQIMNVYTMLLFNRPLRWSECRTLTRTPSSLTFMAMEWCSMNWSLGLCLIQISTTGTRWDTPCFASFNTIFHHSRPVQLSGCI